MKNYWLEKKKSKKIKVNFVIKSIDGKNDTVMAYEASPPDLTQRFGITEWLAEPIAEVGEHLWYERIGRFWNQREELKLEVTEKMLRYAYGPSRRVTKGENGNWIYEEIDYKSNCRWHIVSGGGIDVKV